MSKPASPRKVGDKEALAVNTSVRGSPYKLNLVAGLIRGKKVATALADLEFSRKRIAKDVRKCLQSAIANAENNHELVGDDLYVKEIYADEGPTLRRFRPRAQGRATRIRKRTSHLTVGLSTRE